MKKIIVVLLFISSVFAIEPTTEQLALMRQYGLTMPPIIRESRTDRIPEPSEQCITVSTTENGKTFNVEFGYYKNTGAVANRKAEILDEKPIAEIIVLEFYASWCEKCKSIKDEVDATERELKNIKIVRLDRDKEKEMAAKYNVTGLPRMILLVDGVKKADRVGADECRGMKTWIADGISGKPSQVFIQKQIPSYSPPPERCRPRPYYQPRRVSGRSW